MNLPPFTLVHRPSTGPQKPWRELEKGWIDYIEQRSPALTGPLRDLRPKLRRTLLISTTVGTGLAGSRHADLTVRLPADLESFEIVSEAPLGRLSTLVDELTRQDRVLAVGIWDLGARVGRLPSVIERINAAQAAFTFFEVQAAVPAGLISRPERIASWARQSLGRPLRRAELEEMELNVIDSDFFDRAGAIRRDLGIDYLASVTPSRVAGEDEASLYWNYFSSSRGPLLLVSASDLRRFARDAGRPFEVAVVFLVVGQLLVEGSSRLEFHDDTGCLFDLNIERATLVESLRSMRIEATCLDKIDPRYREAAGSIMKALRSIRGRSR